jgi:acyl-homoserine lactone acylase PvdQ
MAKKVKKESNTGLAILGGLAAAAAAGAYFIYGNKEVQKKAKKVKGWALKAKGEVLEKMEKWKKDFNESDYQELVDKMAQKYQNMKDIDQAELQAFAKEMKSHWKNIKKSFKPAKK